MEGETLEGEENTSVAWSGEVGLPIGETRRVEGEGEGITAGAKTGGQQVSRKIPK